MMKAPREAKQRTILFLIADTGAGHRSAANALSNAISLLREEAYQRWLADEDTTVDPPPTYRIEIVDVFEEYSRFPLREAVKLYGPAIRYNPRLYGEIFHRSNHEQLVLAGNTIASPLIFNGLLRLFTSVQPDLIVSIHPMVNFVTVRVLREIGLKIPFITVVTDLVSVHYSWFAPGADAYVVPTEQAKKLYLERGLDPERVSVLGMPIDLKFSRPVASKEELQKSLGLRPDLPTVLLVGGGDGAGGLQTAVRAISQARLPVQLVIVTGRNKRLYSYLQRIRKRLFVPALILGFVNNMPELMHVADVIVTKAGPGTICEALSCHLPVILSGYIPGQEEGNIDYVVKNQAGLLALDPQTLVDSLRRILKPGSPELKQFVENARRLAGPRASFNIAQHLLSYLPPSDDPGFWQSEQWQKCQQKLAGRLRAAARIPHLARRAVQPLSASTAMRRLLHLGRRTRDLSEAEERTRDLSKAEERVRDL